METLERIIGEHPFFRDLAPEYLALICGCASNVRFAPGEFILREGAEAERFYLIRHGLVDLEIHGPAAGVVPITTLREGQVLGVSWLFPPYRWQFDGRARTMVRTIAMDARCLRKKADENPAMGYDLMKRFSAVMAERLQSARLQLLDVYGKQR